MTRIYQVVIFLFIVQIASAQNYFSENERFYKLTNGLELLLIKDKNQDQLSLSYTSKAGAFTESKELNGLTKVFGDLFFIKNVEQASTDNNQELFRQGILQSSSVGEEHLSFVLNFTGKNLTETALLFLKKQIEDTTITQAALDYTLQKLSFNYRPERAEKLLWGDYYNRMEVSAKLDVTSADIKKNLKLIQSRNLCPQNSLVVITGDFDFKSMLETVQNTLGRLEKCNFSYFNQYPIPKPEPLRFNQQILSYDNTNFRAEYYFQGPTIRDDVKLILAGSVLDQIFKDQYGREGISINLKALYYANTLSLKAKGNNKAAFNMHFETLQNTFLSGKKPVYLTEELVESTIDKLLSQLKIITGEPKLKVQLTNLMWASKDINLVQSLLEELEKIKLNDIENLITSYVHNKNYIVNLVVPSPGALSDSLEIETGSKLEDYELLFKRNTGELLNPAQDSIFKNLLYFLKLNPNINVKIVGLASKSELSDIKDKDTYNFIKNEFEGFNIFPPTLRPSSSKIRLDIYRSVKIAEKLFQSDISVTRLFGSGRMNEEDSPEIYKVYFRLNE